VHSVSVGLLFKLKNLTKQDLIMKLGHLRSIILVATVLTLVSCGTLFNNNPQKVKITSFPVGARVKVDGVDRGATPLELYLNNDKNHVVEVKADGYAKTRTGTLESSIAVRYIIGNLFLCVVPIAIDYYFNKLYRFKDDSLHFQIAPVVKKTYSSGGFKFGLSSRRRSSRNRRKFGRKDRGSGQGKTKSSKGNYCCVNKRYYGCPDLDAVHKCTPPGLGGCLMKCGMDMSCPSKCQSKFPIDTSRCSRTPANDGRCKRR
jgi:PEGA domain